MNKLNFTTIIVENGLNILLDETIIGISYDYNINNKIKFFEINFKGYEKIKNHQISAIPWEYSITLKDKQFFNNRHFSPFEMTLLHGSFFVSKN